MRFNLQLFRLEGLALPDPIEVFGHSRAVAAGARGKSSIQMTVLTEFLGVAGTFVKKSPLLSDHTREERAVGLQ